MIRPWIGIALLGVSWLIGLDYYEMANPWLQGIVLVLGAWMLTAGERTSPYRAVRAAYPELAVTIVLLLIPVIWWTPWPYRLPLVAIVAGLILEKVPYAKRAIHPATAALVVGGVILLAQSIALSLYAAGTARGHDLPDVAVRLIAGLCSLAGIDAAGDGPALVVQTMRQSHRLAVTWDMIFDPATWMFFVGGACWLTIDAGWQSPIRLRWAPWARAMGQLALILAVWLPIRAIVLLSLYIHRVATTETTSTLHVMNQFVSSWVLLGLLAGPIVICWRWIRLLGGGLAQADEEAGAPSPQARIPALGSESAWAPSAKYLAAAACCLLGAILLAAGWQWEPAGKRKAGRVMFVEKHSPWTPSDRPYNTEIFGGDGEDGSSYNYAVAAQYLGQFYEVSQLKENEAIDEQSLARCDVLIIKIPRVRYSPDEVRAVVQFVNNGGGLLFVGDHTNLERSSAHMNDIARHFGFAFRDDVLYSCQASPDQQRYHAPAVPHPAIQHVPAFDFAVSCSIDPGGSWGRPVIAATGLWSMPSDYHIENYMPYAAHVPETRFGSFVQAWAGRSGNGRVIAWGDSTVFSSFCFHQPGKAEALLNMIEWLNHEGGSGVWWLMAALGAAAIGKGLWLVRDDGSAWLVLVAATACGWTLGSVAATALQVRDLRMPAKVHPLPCVVIDRTSSSVPLAKGAFNEDRVRQSGFGLLEQWISRLGYTTVRAEGDAVFQGDAVVMLYPSRPLSEAFRKRLVEYVAAGGRLLVIDAGLNEVASTANQILRPFGMALDYSQPWQGELVLVDPWPRIKVESAWQVQGGQPLATLNGERPVCATTSYGKGLVMAVSFGTLFNDKNMGGNWSHEPEIIERMRYDVLFALLRRLVRDEPVVIPPNRAGSNQPRVSVPLSRPAPRDSAPPRTPKNQGPGNQ